MTIEARTTFTAPKRKTRLASPLENGGRVTASLNAVEARIETPNLVFWVKYDQIEAVIEILFAIKAEREAQAAFEKKWLAEQEAIDIHTLEPTA